MEIGFWIAILAIFILLLLSAFFSGSETAVTAASYARMHALEKKGNKRAGLVNKLREKKDRLIGALLLGNNLVNILASALATSVLIKMFGEAGVAYATLGMTLLVLIFAEVLPKTYAINYADRMALAIIPVIRVIVAVFAPVTDAVTYIVRKALKFLGVDITAVAVGSHIEEMRGAIELHQSPDEDTQEERAMLHSILDLADVDVEEVMVHRRDVMMLDADMPADRIVDEVLASPFTRMPIWQGEPENIVGVLHTKWLLQELRRSNGDLSRVDIRAAAVAPWFIPETTTLFDQLQEFRSRREHFALIVDEYGSLVGVVTLEDILEEIVGEIEDEHDVATRGVRPQTDGSFLIDGKVTIRDLNRDYDWNFPDDEYHTLAGLLLFESQSIPNVGQAFTFFNFRFEVVRKYRNQLSLIRVIKCPDENCDELMAAGAQGDGAAVPAV